MLKILLLSLPFALLVQAADHTYQFSGVTAFPINQVNAAGAVTATIPAGTAYTGTFTFSDTQTMTSVPNYYGGTMNTFSFSSMTLSMLGATGNSGPGTITLLDNLTQAALGSLGDIMYVNFDLTTRNPTAMTGAFNGVQLSSVFLEFIDPTGTALTAGAFPTNLNFASLTGGAVININDAALNQFVSPLSSLAPVAAGVPPTITTSSLPPGVVGVAYATAVAATAPNGDALTFSVSGLPAGLTFSGTAIAGTPAAAGTSTVNITATDTVTNLSTTAALPLVVSNPAIVFTPTLAAGVAGASYSSTFSTATGGTGVFTYTATGLPAGLSLLSTTVSGTPAAAGSYPVSLTAKDSSGATVTSVVTLTITTPAFTVCSGSNGVISAYVPRNPGFIVVNGGFNLLDHLWTTLLTPATVTFQGGLINWYQTGLIVSWTGTTDVNGCILDHLTVSPGVHITTASLPNGVAGIAYSAPVAVSWGVAPYKVTVSGLPAGLSYANGSLTGVPAVVGTFNVAITAIDAVGATASKTLPLAIVDQPIGFAPTLPAGTVGVAYSASLSATGFGPFTYTATGLPAGLTLGVANISGTPAVAGVFSVVITAKDASGVTASSTVALTIAAPVGHYTVQDESKGVITAVGPGYLMVGSKKLIWNNATYINVNTPDTNLNTITSYVVAGMKVQWKGLRDPATNTVLCSQIEVN